MENNSLNTYMIGQRVFIYGSIIGHIVKPEHYNSKGIWAFNPEKGYASCYDPRNIKPLPTGQL